LFDGVTVDFSFPPNSLSFSQLTSSGVGGPPLSSQSSISSELSLGSKVEADEEEEDADEDEEEASPAAALPFPLSVAAAAAVFRDGRIRLAPAVALALCCTHGLASIVARPCWSAEPALIGG